MINSKGLLIKCFVIKILLKKLIEKIFDKKIIKKWKL